MEAISQVLDAVTQAYRDTRVRYCRLDVRSLDGADCALAGGVLDDATLAAVLADLMARCSGLTFDTSAVRVLRGPGIPSLAVATNLTGLYAHASFLSEQLSQVLNDARLEILLTEGRWAFVRQVDGYLGWVYRPYLTEPNDFTATHLVCEPVSLLRAAPAAQAPLVSRILGGTALALDEADEPWAHVTLAGGVAGWASVIDLRACSALPQGEIARRSQLVADAARFIGVPYLWGGVSAFGIDCSGFAQLLHRLVGVTLPRDADQQYNVGRPIEPPFQPGDLLFFGDGAAAPKITHVGLSLGGWRIIHSSRSRNGVYEDDVQAVEHLRESFAGARTFVGM